MRNQRHKFSGSLSQRVLLPTIFAFLRDRAGGAAPLVALVSPILVGFAGLAVDVSVWYSEARQVAQMADAAATAGALEILRDGDGGSVQAAAIYDAEANGLELDDGDSITINSPPQSGPFAGVGNAVEVIVRRPAETFFSGMFAAGGTIANRAVALADINDMCIWALSETDRAAVKVAGSATVDLGCGVVANSADADAMDQSGGGCLTATSLRVVGGYNGDCLNPTPITDIRPVEDPLNFLEAPLPTGCNHTTKTKVNAGEYKELYPGIYCKSIEVSGGGQVYFHPGLYILDGAGLTFASQSVVEGHGVTFVLTSESGPSGNISIAGGAIVDLSAMEDGEYTGILFFHDRDSSDNVSHNLSGGSTMQLDGIIYFPNQNLKFAGGSELDAVASFIIADTVEFVGKSYIDASSGTAVRKNRLLISSVLVD